MAILCVDNEEDMKVIDENLGEYFNYLDENIDFSGMVIGIEDFRWDEYYVIGPGDRKELEDLKAFDKSPENFQILDDYSVWFVNYR